MEVRLEGDFDRIFTEDHIESLRDYGNKSFGISPEELSRIERMSINGTEREIKNLALAYKGGFKFEVQF